MESSKTLEDHFKEITKTITMEQSRELSEDERLLSHGEVNAVFSPLLYGEASYSAIAEIIQEIREKCKDDEQVKSSVGEFGSKFGKEQDGKNGVAVDLGSGSGKVSLSLALCASDVLAKSIGVELLQGLHEQSLELKKIYDAYPDLDKKCELIFEQYDFLQKVDHNALRTEPEKDENTGKDKVEMKLKWIDADLIFANATAFEPPMMSTITNEWLRDGKLGSVMILTTKEMDQEEKDFTFVEFDLGQKLMSWGNTAVKAYVKIL